MTAYHHLYPNGNEVIINTKTVAYVLLIHLTPGPQNAGFVASLDIYFVGATNSEQEPGLRFWFADNRAAYSAQQTLLEKLG